MNPKVIWDVLSFVGSSVGLSIASSYLVRAADSFKGNAKLVKLTNTVAEDPESTEIVFGTISRFRTMLGLSEKELEAAVLAIRLIAHISPKSLNAMYTNGTLSTLDDIVKFADYTSARSYNLSSMTEPEYLSAIANAIGTTSVKDASGEADEIVEVNTKKGPMKVSKDNVSSSAPHKSASDTKTSTDALGEVTWSQVANTSSNTNMTDVGTNNQGVSIATYVLQQALILAGFGNGVYEGENLPILKVTGLSNGTDPNTVYFNMLLGDYYEAIGEPRRRSYNIKLVYQLYQDIVSEGETGPLVDAVKNKLISYMDAIDPLIKTKTSIFKFKRPRDKYAYGEGSKTLSSETELWNLGAQPSAEKMIDIERALIDIGYYVGFNQPQTSRSVWKDIDDESIHNNSIDKKLSLAQGTNGVYRNKFYSWISVNNVARALADSGVMTDAQIKTWYATRAWTNNIGKALRILLEENEPESVMLEVFTAAKYP
jgi:hypothetical protein